MPKRHKRIQTLTVQKCEWCKESHSFSLDVLIEREVEAMGMLNTKIQRVDIVLACPITGKDIVVSVPVSINPLVEKLIEVHIQ